MQAVSEMNGTFLSTFRINDGQKKDNTKTRQRHRKILSCNPCHRSKVKCDRCKPCARCTALGRPAACKYSDDAPSPRNRVKARSYTPDDVTVQHEQEPIMYYTGPSISVQHAGLTHWTRLYDEFEEVKEYVFGQKPDFRETFNQITQLKQLYRSRHNPNFPFGNSRHEAVSRASIIQHVPPPDVVAALVENYLETFEVTHRLLHPPSFRDELNNFWNDPPRTSDVWLAQLLTMLSLSCNSAPDHIFENLEQTREQLADECLDWAESALKRSSFMSFPELNTLITLTMMLIAKSFEVVAPAMNDGQFALIGFIVRMAMSLSLHRDPIFFPSVQHWEARMRRRIWNTIVFLDLKIATDSGMPALIRRDDWDTRAPLNLNDDRIVLSPMEKDLANKAGIRARPQFDEAGSERNSMRKENYSKFKLPPIEPEPEEILTDSSLEIKLSQAYPIISTAISTINSMQPQMAYDKVLEFDAKLREVLMDAQVLFAKASEKANDNAHARRIMLQRSTLEIFLRRTLLAIHRPFARGSLENSMREKSHWSVLECSLALINLQQNLHDASAGSNSVLWLMDLFQGTFSCAMVYTLLSLRRDAFDYIPEQFSQQSARETARVALKGSIDIVKLHVARTFIYLKTFMGIYLAAAALDALQAGKPLHESMLQAGQFIIDTVLSAKGVRHDEKTDDD